MKMTTGLKLAALASALTALIPVGIVAAVLGLSACQRDNAGKVETITLGTVLLEPSLPIFVAEDQNYFTRNGLNVTIKYYDVGLRAADGVLNDEVDISSPVAEYVMVGKIFDNKKIQAVASIDKVDYAFVVGRKDRAIKIVPDLKGKRIGVVRGTILEFQLGRFLELHGMNIKDLVLVNGTLPQSAEAIVSGETDAVMSIPPFIGTVQSQLGDNAILWSAQNSQPFYSLIVGMNEWIRQHPRLIERFLMAMKQAEEYINQHPGESKAILKRKLNFTDDDVARVWSQNQFSLSLDQSLILAMEDEARWMISNNLTAEKQVPDFLDYIYTKGLEAVKPGAVSIIR